MATKKLDIQKPARIIVSVRDGYQLWQDFSWPCIYFIEDFVYLDVTNRTGNSLYVRIYVENPLDEDKILVTTQYIRQYDTRTILLNAFGKEESANGHDYTYNADITSKYGELNCQFELQ